MLLDVHKNRFIELLNQSHLEGVEELILSGARSCLKMCASQHAIELGCSKFAGNPDLPPNCSWRDELEDLVFLFQINFAELAFHNEFAMPEKGMLYVFSDQAPHSGRCFYSSPHEGPLQAHIMPPPDPEYIFSDMITCRLSWTTHVDFPDYGSEEYDVLEDLGLIDDYETLVEDFYIRPKKPPFLQLFGRTADLNCDLRSLAAEEKGGDVGEWQEFWKVFSSFESGLVISDFHVLHGLIKTKDLERLHFSDVYVCTDVV